MINELRFHVYDRDAHAFATSSNVFQDIWTFPFMPKSYYIVDMQDHVCWNDDETLNYIPDEIAELFN